VAEVLKWEVRKSSMYNVAAGLKMLKVVKIAGL
jgi:hypothetical protein